MPTHPSKTIDLIELVKDGRHFAEKRGERIHIIDSVTGNTIVVYTDAHNGNIPTHFLESALPNGSTVWIQEGINPVVGGLREVAFNPVTVDLICQKIAEGGNLTKICTERGMPTYPTFCRWKRAHPWIEEQLESARRDRAEYLRDRAVEEALAADSDNVGAQSLKHEAMKWAAGVDHGKYSPKAKVEATLNVPTQIIVSTGIDRTPPAEKDVTPPLESPKLEAGGE